MIKAVVFDIDNTLTQGVSWLRITELLGASVAEHETIFRNFLDGRLSYEAAVQQLTDLWRATGKVDKTYWEHLFADWPLLDGAEELVQCVANKGYQAALITGSLDLFAETLAHRLQVPYWYANARLIWDEHGELISFEYEKDQAGRKLLHLQQFTARLGITLDECVIVADGDNDVETFKATGHGIAVGSTSAALQAVAWKQVASLGDVIKLLEDL